MSLDLNELTASWVCPPDSIGARLILGRDGAQLVQLRIDLGLLQMFPDGRPDSQRYHGLPTVLDFIQHEVRVGAEVADADWNEIQRELHQFNYRRLALQALAEPAVRSGDRERALPLLWRAARDIEHCLSILRLLEEEQGGAGQHVTLIPRLVFERGRTRARLRWSEGRFDEAVDEAEDGRRALSSVLARVGFDAEAREQDSGVVYLRELAERLRRDYGVRQTLRERLNTAIEQEDFESAARLRAEIQQRKHTSELPPLPSGG
jgi:hypothetical protein